MTKVAAIQMVSGLNIKNNLDEMNRLVCKATQKGANLVLLPEFFALLSDQHEDKVSHAETPLDLYKDCSLITQLSPIQRALSKAAKDNNVWVVGGTIPLKTERKNKIFNSMLAFNEKGILVGRYDKVHLFKYKNKKENYDETKFISAGKKKCLIKTPVGNTFFSVCYDIRFPEFYRNKEHSSSLLDLILVSAAFTYETGKAHWELLLRTRAIENQCYVLASAQGGKHECGRETWGHSMLIDPWGDIIKESKFGTSIVIGDVSHQKISDVRNKLPAIFHQQYDL